MNSVNHYDQGAREFALRIANELHRQGFLAYFAGGCVRDQILGNTPHDYDIATDARPEQVREIFGARNTLFVGASFGVVCVHGFVGKNRHQVEVATFRSDGLYSDGRHPDCVHFAPPELDAQRRDFTINGLFYDPISDQVIDFVGGVDDIRSGVLRAIGDPYQRFGEDKLRLLRAIRFAARFQLKLDPATHLAISSLASTLRVVSAERIAAELRKIAELTQRHQAVESLFETELLKVIFVELYEDWSHYSKHRMQSLECLKRLDLFTLSPFIAALTFASLDSLSIDESMHTSRAIAQRLKSGWKISNDEASDIEYLLEGSRQLTRSDLRRWSDVQPTLADKRATQLSSLIHALDSEQQGKHSAPQFVKQVLAWPVEKRDPAPFLTGQDLKQAGFKPGPAYAETLRLARQLQLDGQIVDRTEALRWLTELAKSPS